MWTSLHIKVFSRTGNCYRGGKLILEVRRCTPNDDIFTLLLHTWDISPKVLIYDRNLAELEKMFKSRSWQSRKPWYFRAGDLYRLGFTLREKDDPDESDLRTAFKSPRCCTYLFLTLVHPLGYIISIVLGRRHNWFLWNKSQEGWWSFHCDALRQRVAMENYGDFSCNKRRVEIQTWRLGNKMPCEFEADWQRVVHESCE